MTLTRRGCPLRPIVSPQLLLVVNTSLCWGSPSLGGTSPARPGGLRYSRRDIYFTAVRPVTLPDLVARDCYPPPFVNKGVRGDMRRRGAGAGGAGHHAGPRRAGRPAVGHPEVERHRDHEQHGEPGDGKPADCPAHGQRGWGLFR